MKNIFYKKPYIYISISAIFFLVIFGAYILLDSKMKNLTQTTAENLSQISVLTKKNKDLQLLRNTLKSTEADRLLLNTHFVSEASVGTFLESIENLGVKSNTQVVLSNVKKEENPKTLLISLKATGGFSDTMTLVGLIEQLPYGVVVEKILLNKKIEATNFVPAPTKEDPKAVVKTSSSPKWDLEITFRLISFTS